ncbi:SIR2 family NAD-dependent protein deacylase [Flavobacterium algicola]|uniref:SIR2 family NAD-dependent protein deacylase n=1 Tax=Flavobacterium algicola TaxID=556529 RepID=UPI001EFC5CD2|nr:NAD-dependent deacylase [Flavobacterium algicola]MCG9793303.1 NAD-dependent deacylase [Flavobacterium algicola]
MKKKLVILSGAGMSAESGIKTFRDSDGLWEGYNVMDVATPQGWQKNSALVLDFYNQRRKQLLEVEPNIGHLILAEMEKDYDVHVITQNVDDLHERAGSTNVLHLHGELLKVKSTVNDAEIQSWKGDLVLGDVDTKGNQLRPHIVWFGEDVPALEEAIDIVEGADYLVVIGTSLQVYPAAGLIDFASKDCLLFYIDPKPAPIPNLKNKLELIPMNIGTGIVVLQDKLRILL